MKQEFRFTFDRYESVDSLPEADRCLATAAEKATENSFAPYSRFRVGAAARLASGRIVTGANIESEVFPSGLCAERTLLYHCQANHADDPVTALAIASRPSQRECYPCGGCRQTLLDTERRQKLPIRIIMTGGGTASVVDSAERLLPFTFEL
ncbi:cytidine deaminase [Alistipes sp. Z76]|jgi:cytidine deaminase|nr:cytidine deaminase [Alistipes sp. Z76]NCE68853.1 cytidine deaminase [Muribaculaceae bacterium M3]